MREIRWLVLGLVFGAALVVVGSARNAASVHAQGAPPAQRWEYQCFEEWGGRGAEIATRANELGAQGWEMVAAASPSERSVPAWCFKRPLR